jgi:hypothetical protein
MAHLPP